MQEDHAYTPETLREFAQDIETLRHDILLDTDSAGADAESETHYLLALAALETAHRHFKLAAIKQSLHEMGYGVRR